MDNYPTYVYAYVIWRSGAIQVNCGFYNRVSRLAECGFSKAIMRCSGFPRASLFPLPVAPHH